MKTDLFVVLATAAVLGVSFPNDAPAADNTPPPGFTALFNGKDLTGWKGLLKPPLGQSRPAGQDDARSNWPRPRKRPTR